MLKQLHYSSSFSTSDSQLGCASLTIFPWKTRARSLIVKYTIISKYGKRRRQLKFKKELENFPFALELNEEEVIELLENATPMSIKKAARYGIKIFQGTKI